VVQEEQKLRELFSKRYWVCDKGKLRKRCSGGGAKKDSPLGSPDKDGYLSLKVGDKYYKVHRIIFLMHYGYLPNLVDHRNQNKADNRPSNLRDATTSENAINIDKANSGSLSGVRGVTYRKRKGKYEVNFRRKYLGLYGTIEEAAKVYADAKRDATTCRGRAVQAV
tara:strand:- start:18481 stop:18978 length:498 start_codon:yes stop_codon:yes gene_type:complete